MWSTVIKGMLLAALTSWVDFDVGLYVTGFYFGNIASKHHYRQSLHWYEEFNILSWSTVELVSFQAVFYTWLGFRCFFPEEYTLINIIFS